MCFSEEKVAEVAKLILVGREIVVASLFQQLNHNVQISQILMTLIVSSKQMCVFMLFCVPALFSRFLNYF